MFTPSFCPSSTCPSRSNARFRFKCRGRYYRRCDGRYVQRFQCKTCGLGFSAQTFRVDYRLWKPWLLLRVFDAFVSKVSHRQTARIEACNRDTVARHLIRLGDHCRAFQAQALKNQELAPDSSFLLDELETYEHNRRLSPLTVPVLIESHSGFVVSTEVGTLPSRGSLSPRWAAEKAARAAQHGPRRSQSREMVRRCFEQLVPLVKSFPYVRVGTDQKSSYPGVLRETLGERVRHVRTHSSEPRTLANPLFAINHTLAMLRDGLGRLVRRTWGASKKGERLLRHLWIWIGYRNFVRGMTNKKAPTTPAMSLGIERRPLDVTQLLARRVFPGVG